MCSQETHVHAHTKAHRHTHTTPTWLVTQTATDKALLQQHPCTGLTSDTSPDSHVPSSSWAGRGRRSLVQHTQDTLQVHKHNTFVDLSSTGIAPLSTRHPSSFYPPHGSRTSCLHPGLSGLHPYQYQTAENLQFSDSPLISVTCEVCFLSLSPSCLSARFVSLYIFFMASLFSLVCRLTWSSIR